MAKPVTPNMRQRYFCVRLDSIGTAKSCSTPCTVNGTVLAISVSQDVAVDADNVVKGQINTTDITGATVTLKTTDTVNVTVKTALATAANTVKRGQCLTAVTDGGGGAGQCMVTFVVDEEVT